MVTEIKIPSSAYVDPYHISFKRNVVDSGALYYGNWVGVAELLASAGSVASASIKTWAQERNFTAPSDMVIPGGAYIYGLRFRTLGAITIDGTATGTLKLATAATTTTSGLVVSSAAAVSNVVAAQSAPVEVLNPDTPVTVGASDYTFKIFATDGANVADTMSVSTDTKIIVQVLFCLPPKFPTLIELGTEAPAASDNITSY